VWILCQKPGSGCVVKGFTVIIQGNCQRRLTLHLGSVQCQVAMFNLFDVRCTSLYIAVHLHPSCILQGKEKLGVNFHRNVIAHAESDTYPLRSLSWSLLKMLELPLTRISVEDGATRSFWPLLWASWLHLRSWRVWKNWRVTCQRCVQRTSCAGWQDELLGLSTCSFVLDTRASSSKILSFCPCYQFFSWLSFSTSNIGSCHSHYASLASVGTIAAPRIPFSFI